MALTPKQERFVEEYLVDLNGTQAAIRSGYSPATANRIAAELLSKPDIQEEVRKAKLALSERAQVTQEQVLEELCAVAFFDIQTLFDERGNPLPLWQLPPRARAGISGISIIEGTGPKATTIRIKIHDKVRALEVLLKHLRPAAPKAAPGLTIDTSAIAKMTDEELEAAARNLDKLIGAMSPHGFGASVPLVDGVAPGPERCL